MKKIVVTGASGFIGKALCKKLLSEDNYVYAIVRDRAKLEEFKAYDNFQIIELELKEYYQLSTKIKDTIDVIYHFAWSASAGAGRSDYSIQIPQIQYTCDLVMEAAKLHCKKIIFAGSVSYFMKKHYLNEERNRCEQTCIYGTAKNATNLFISTLCHNLGIDYNDLLFTNIFGVGDYSLRSTNTIINKLLHNECPPLVEGNYAYDWFYIDNAVDAILSVTAYGHPFKSYYIGNKDIGSLKELLTKIATIVNPNIQLKFGTVKDTTHVDYSKVDTNKLYKDTGYTPHVSFEESILRTIEWVKFLNA